MVEIGTAGTTLLYTTHYMEEAQQLCNRVAIMDRGHIIARGSSAELMAAHPDCRNLGEVFMTLTGHSLRDSVV